MPSALGLIHKLTRDVSCNAAPLGRAVIGGLALATLATLGVLSAVFAVVQGRSTARSASLDPHDPESGHFVAG